MNDRYKQIREAYVERELSTRALSLEFAVDRKTVSNALHAQIDDGFGDLIKERLALVRSVKSITDTQIEEAKQRFLKGESIVSLAQEYGISATTLHKWVAPPERASIDLYQKRIDLSSPHLKVQSLRKESPQKNSTTKGTKVYVTLTDLRDGRTFEVSTGDLFRALKKDVNYVFFPSAEVISQKRVDSGNVKLINGVQIKDYAVKVGCSYSTVQQKLKTLGETETIRLLNEYKTFHSSLEALVSSWLEGHHIVKGKQLEGTKFRPDLYLPEYDLVIECDGLYWHSEAGPSNLDRKYHWNKRVSYEHQGKRALFFRQDELLTKPEICKSIIFNALKKNLNKIGARKTFVSSDAGSAEFFVSYHLMGKGRGRHYFLVHEGRPVAGIAVAWVKEGLLDVSRYCTLPNVSVTGGFSKLISAVIEAERPTTIQTFIDLRYGSGSYLAGLGWTFIRASPSFKWTNFRETFHRMRYPGSTGYDYGLSKIWDCGQAKWELKVK